MLKDAAIFLGIKGSPRGTKNSNTATTALSQNCAIILEKDRNLIVVRNNDQKHINSRNASIFPNYH